MRSAIIVCCAAATVLLALVAPACADIFGPISLASQGTFPGFTNAQQADYAGDPAVSADGRYVAFDGSFAGNTGVWRRDLSNGVIEEVAGGQAVLPSINENGQYVSFTTREQLVSGDHGENPEVYVRNMDIPLPASLPCTETASVNGECPFELVSAVNDPSNPSREEAMSYETSEPKRYGSLASGRSAISANGRLVAFVTTAVSNLVDREVTDTPALQVAVRDLETKQTELVSVEYDPTTGQPAKFEEGPDEGRDRPAPTIEEGSGEAFGAVYPGGARIPQFEGPSRSASINNGWVGASISADGSTVAWMGQYIAAQAPVLPADPARNHPGQYTEPLWRRIDEGPAAPTRRITGGSDPLSPACAASGETSISTYFPSLTDPCQGPFAIEDESLGGTWTIPIGGYLPQLSRNGLTVAFVANAREVASGEEFGSTTGFTDDLYVANMQTGLTRVQALRRLTEIAGGQSTDTARVGAIVDVGVSPDGSQVAFSTWRTVFPLGSLAYVSVPAAVPGMVELYDVDLANNTLTRVTHGFEGEQQPSEQPHAEATGGQDPYESNEGSFSPSFSEDGNTLVFSSSASNLVYGDGNGASNAFAVHRTLFPATPTPQYVSPAPANPPLAPGWRLGITAASRRDGSVLLYVETPGPGDLRAGAISAVRIRSVVSARAGRRARSSKSRKAHVVVSVASRTVATATHTSDGGLVTLAIALAPRYRTLASARGGLSASVTLTFSAGGHPTLRQSVPVTFVRTVKPARKSSASKASRRR